MKQLVALVDSPDHVCVRYRLAAFRPALAAAGWQLELVPLPKRPFARMGLLRKLRWADAVLVQRKLIPRLEVNLLRRAVRRLVFDFDDAVWLRDSYAPKGLDAPRRAYRFAAVVHAADRVIAGNDYLAGEARMHTTADRVTVVPTCVEPAPTRWPPTPATGCGWCGSGRPARSRGWTGSGPRSKPSAGRYRG